MSSAMTPDRRQRILTELGLVSYRLRTSSRNTAAKPESATPSPRLCVTARDAAAPPGSNPAAAIWTQVLTWLGRTDDEVDWQADQDGAIVLPPVASWATPEGKRGLWLALKRQAKGRC